MKFASVLLALVAFALVATVAEAKREYVLSMNRCHAGARFTLHGLWPQWGMNCPGEKFDERALDVIRDRLDILWPSCPPDSSHITDNVSFWTHEWKKHGTCAQMGFVNYFNVSMDLLEEYSHLCPDTTDVEVAPGYYYPVPNKDCRICLTEDFTPCKKRTVDIDY